MYTGLTHLSRLLLCLYTSPHLLITGIIKKIISKILYFKSCVNLKIRLSKFLIYISDFSTTMHSHKSYKSLNLISNIVTTGKMFSINDLIVIESFLPKTSILKCSNLKLNSNDAAGLLIPENSQLTLGSDCTT